MPLRRRPPEPSPRLRALLASGSALPARGTADPPPAGGTAEPPPARISSAAPPVTAWQPDRDWLEDVGGPHAVDRRPPQRPSTGGRHRRPTPPGPRFFALPQSFVGARLSGPRAAVAGLLIVVVVA
ncbi:hypothetical protein, partial [Pedococcus soli]